jgi:hypothetical protein
MAEKRAVVDASPPEGAGGWGGRFRQTGPTGQREWTSEQASALTSRGPRNNTRKHARAEGFGTDKSVHLGSERERGKSAGAGWRRQAGTICQRKAGALAGGLDGASWAG